MNDNAVTRASGVIDRAKKNMNIEVRSHEQAVYAGAIGAALWSWAEVHKDVLSTSVGLVPVLTKLTMVELHRID